MKKDMKKALLVLFILALTGAGVCHGIDPWTPGCVTEAENQYEDCILGTAFRRGADECYQDCELFCSADEAREQAPWACDGWPSDTACPACQTMLDACNSEYSSDMDICNGEDPGEEDIEDPGCGS